MSEHAWLDIPGLTGYQIRDDWQKVRSVTRRIWQVHPEFGDVAGGIPPYLGQLSEERFKANFSSPRVIFGKELTMTLRRGVPSYRIHSTYYTVPRLRDAVKYPAGRKIKKPPSAPKYIDIL